MGLLEELRVDKTAFSVAPLSQASGDREYWLKKNPAERMAAIEVSRQIIYGYDPSSERLQRVLEIAQRA